MKDLKAGLERCRIAKDELKMLEVMEFKSKAVEEEIKKLKKIRSDCEKMIMELPHTLWRAYLLARFIDCQTYGVMAENFGVDERTCYRNVKKGIVALQNINKK